MDDGELSRLAGDRSADLGDEAALRRVYTTGPGATSLQKVADHVHALYCAPTSRPRPSPCWPRWGATAWTLRRAATHRAS